MRSDQTMTETQEARILTRTTPLAPTWIDVQAVGGRVTEVATYHRTQNETLARTWSTTRVATQDGTRIGRGEV